MLFFVISLAAGVAAVLGAQKMDIECDHPRAPKRAAPRRNNETRLSAPAGFASSAALLRQQ